MKTLYYYIGTSIKKLVLICLLILTTTLFGLAETKSDSVSAEILMKLDSPIIHRTVRLSLKNNNKYIGRIKEQTEDSLKLKFENGDSIMIWKNELKNVERSKSKSGTRYRFLRWMTFIVNQLVR